MKILESAYLFGNRYETCRAGCKNETGAKDPAYSRNGSWNLYRNTNQAEITPKCTYHIDSGDGLERR